LFLRSMSAVALVAALVALLLQWRGQDTPSTSSENGPGPAVVAPSTLGPGSATPTPTPSAVTSAPATIGPSPTPTRVVLPLGVYNNSRRVGLARRAAEEFRKGGWPATVKGDYRATKLPATTVYYTVGNDREKLAAESLHRQFPHVERVQPRFTGLPGKGLIVILTQDYPA
jgi:hypothetical protein